MNTQRVWFLNIMFNINDIIAAQGGAVCTLAFADGARLACQPSPVVYSGIDI